MATVRHMINANEVFIRLANNPNLYVTTSYKLLPLLTYLTDITEGYLEAKTKIVAEEGTAEEKEQKLIKHLDSDVTLPDITIDVKNLRGCGMTMIDLQHIHWWLDEGESEYEDEEIT